MEAQDFDQWAGWPAPEPPPVKPPSETVMSHVRRYAAAGVLAVGLVASGVAVVAAASPDTAPDWPHPQIAAAVMPDDGHLLDLFTAWTPDARHRHLILVDTPARLFGR